jgi:hypothetical protein
MLHTNYAPCLGGPRSVSTGYEPCLGGRKAQRRTPSRAEVRGLAYIYLPYNRNGSRRVVVGVSVDGCACAVRTAARNHAVQYVVPIRLIRDPGTFYKLGRTLACLDSVIPFDEDDIEDCRHCGYPGCSGAAGYCPANAF